MTTIDSIYKDFKKNFESVIASEKKHDFYIDQEVSSKWVDYGDSDEYVLEDTDWITHIVFEYIVDIVKSDCDGVIDAIVSEFGNKGALDIFNDGEDITFNTIDEIKQYNDKYYFICNTLTYICYSSDLYTTNDGLSIMDSIVEDYANAVGEHFGLF